MNSGNLGVIDGARTHDSQNHNLELYQLSYDHHLKAGANKRRNLYAGNRKITNNSIVRLRHNLHGFRR
jgi:hypothetical protein